MRKLIAALALTAASISMPLIAQAGGTSTPPPKHRVVGGDKANIDEWPGFASIGVYFTGAKTYNHFCGGTFITPTHVLTAAHCIESYTDDMIDKCPKYDIGGLLIDNRSLRIMVAPGMQTLQDLSGDKLYRVKKIHAHPEYGCSGTAKATMENDIAILEVDHPWNGPLMKLSLSEHADPNDGMVGVAGFGRTAKNPNDDLREPVKTRSGISIVASTADLLYTQIRKVDIPTCAKNHSGAGTYTVTDSHICAGFENMPSDSCEGDSGGPLVGYDNAHKAYQIGVVSWGPVNCGERNKPGVYTRVSSQAEWIKSIAGDLDGFEPLFKPNPKQLTEKAVDELLDYLSRGDDKLKLEICGFFKEDDCGKTIVKEGNLARFRITSQRDGRLILFDVNSKGAVTQLFPNALQGEGASGRINAYKTIMFPEPSYGFNLIVQPPGGKSRLIAVLAPPEARIENFAASPKQKTRGINISSWGEDEKEEDRDDDFSAERYTTELLASIRAEVVRLGGDRSEWSAVEIKYEVEE